MATIATPGTRSAESQLPAVARIPWLVFGRKQIDVRDFIQRNYEPYEGNESLSDACNRNALKNFGTGSTSCLLKSGAKGVLDVSQIPTSITAHGSGLH